MHGVLKSRAGFIYQIYESSSFAMPKNNYASHKEGFTEYLRFEDKLQYNINVDEESEFLKIPKMCLQPFVENASVHGIEKIKEHGIININIFVKDAFLNISIEDNGPGMSVEKLTELMSNIQNDSYSGKSVGIRNVYKRLYIYFEKELFFKFHSEYNKGTTVEIRIPIKLLHEKGGDLNFQSNVGG